MDSNVGASPTLMAVHGKYVGMAEQADAPDLGSGGLIHAGSIPVTNTKVTVRFRLVSRGLV